MTDLIQILVRQRAFSLRTFGPNYQTEQAIDHIRKELAEISADRGDIKEWIDVAIIALDGAMRCGYSPLAVTYALVDKISVNEKRTWPDWRTADRRLAIEHIEDAA